ncbi:MAG: hypothetical protein EBQ54_07235 [Actinobacteria bacterium]|nr:hypothetical protein [Actinomycetota bacterium]
MTDWRQLSARASLASHRLIGWIYWDPDAIARYTALGVPNGLGYYIASRAAPLASSGNDVVVAAFYSIRKEFIDLCLDTARKHTTFEDAYRVRNEAVARGLREYAPEIVAPLGEWRRSCGMRPTRCHPLVDPYMPRIAVGRDAKMMRHCQRGWQLIAFVNGGATRTLRCWQATKFLGCKRVCCMMRFSATPAIGFRAVAVLTTRNSHKRGRHLMRAGSFLMDASTTRA